MEKISKSKSKFQLNFRIRDEWKKVTSWVEPKIFQLKLWMEKGHELSRAELKIFQLKLWLEPARLGLITQTKPTQTSSDFIKRAHHRTFIERLWQKPKKLWARESCLLGKPLFLSRNVWVKLTDSPSRWHHLMIIKGLLWHSQPCLAAKWITFGVS